MCFPATEFHAGLTLNERLFGIYPLLLYPCRLVDRGGMVCAEPRRRTGRIERREQEGAARTQRAKDETQ